MFIDFREREGKGGKEVERERERNINVREKHDQLLPISTPTGDRTCNLSKCPNQELNPQPLGVQDNAPTN